MFASLTDYKLGVEDDADLEDKILLRIMDEVISDFDRVCMLFSYNNIGKFQVDVQIIFI